MVIPAIPVLYLELSSGWQSDKYNFRMYRCMQPSKQTSKLAIQKEWYLMNV